MTDNFQPTMESSPGAIRATVSTSRRGKLSTLFGTTPRHTKGSINIRSIGPGEEKLDPKLRLSPRRVKSTSLQYSAVVAVVLGVSLANFALNPLVGVHATALIFLLMVVILSLFVERGPILLAAALSALVWDYFFLPPVFAFRVSHIEDAMLLGMYFVLAIILGQLTAQIRAHQEAERESELVAESERLGKTLLDSMSHEIRTPIAAIKSAAGNLLEFQDIPLSDSQQAMIAEIHEAIERLNRLVGNVLDVTRLESGHVKPKLSLCDVHDLVQVAVKETKKELSRHKLAIDIEPGLPLVTMDFVLTQHALTNLLLNAAFHTPEGTVVQLFARRDGGDLVLLVADYGPGIPENSLPRIFDKFYRAPNTSTGGTGLGLSLVRGFIVAQGGTVEVANDPLAGANFTIRLPLAREC